MSSTNIAIGIESAGTLRGMGTKRLTDEQNERLRDITRELVAKVGSMTKAAAAMGVVQSYVSEFLSGNRGEDANESDAWWLTAYLALPVHLLGETNPHLTPWFQALCEEAHDSITFVIIDA